MSQDPHSVGFADFVAVLIVETLDSIVAAHTSQEERMRALDEALDLSVEDFAATAISDDVLATALIQSFPDGKGGTALIVGGPVPPDSTLEELAVKLTGSDVEGTAPKQTLTARGVKRVTDALALHLASRQLAALREARGEPGAGPDPVRTISAALHLYRDIVARPCRRRGGAALRGRRCGEPSSCGSGPHCLSR